MDAGGECWIPEHVDEVDEWDGEVHESDAVPEGDVVYEGAPDGIPQ